MVRADRSILWAHQQHRLELNAAAEQHPAMDEPRNERWWRHAPHRLLAAAVTGTALFSTDFAQGGPHDPPVGQGGGEAPHGALAMDRQRTAVAALQAGKLDGAAPAGVDPAYWTTLSPADNAANS